MPLEMHCVMHSLVTRLTEYVYAFKKIKVTYIYNMYVLPSKEINCVFIDKISTGVLIFCCFAFWSRLLSLAYSIIGIIDYF